MNCITTQIEKLQLAKNVTKKYQERVREVVLHIEDIMEDLGINQLQGGKYELINKSSNNGIDKSLYLITSSEYENLEIRLCSTHLSSTNEEYYLFQDFSKRYNAPNLFNLKEFVSDLDNIFMELIQIVPDEDDLSLTNAERKLDI